MYRQSTIKSAKAQSGVVLTGLVVLLVFIVVGLFAVSIVKNHQAKQSPGNKSTNAGEGKISMATFDTRYGTKLTITLSYNKDQYPPVHISKVERTKGWVLNYGFKVVHSNIHLQSVTNQGNIAYDTPLFAPDLMMGETSFSNGKIFGGGVYHRSVSEFTVDIPASSNLKSVRITDDKNKQLEIKPIDPSTLLSAGSLPENRNYSAQKAVEKKLLSAVNDAITHVFQPRVYAAPIGPAPINSCSPSNLCIAIVPDISFTNDPNVDVAQLIESTDKTLIGYLYKTNDWWRKNWQAIGFNFVTTPLTANCNPFNANEYDGKVCDGTNVAHYLDSQAQPYQIIVVTGIHADNPAYGGTVIFPIPTAYIEVGSGGQLSIIHELGHALGWLRDEYTYSGSDSKPLYDPLYDVVGNPNAGSSNTTHGNCYAGTPPNQAWLGLGQNFLNIDNYVLGCSYANWHRGAKCSVMGCYEYADPNYDPISEKMMDYQLASIIANEVGDPNFIGDPPPGLLGMNPIQPTPSPTQSPSPSTTAGPTASPVSTATPQPVPTPAATISPSCTPVSPVDSVSATVLSSTSATVSWSWNTPPQDVVNVEIWRAVDGTQPTTVATVIPYTNPSQSWNDTYLSSGHTYQYAIAADCQYGRATDFSAYSASITTP